MIYIAHRGNIVNEGLDNEPSTIMHALSLGYDAEIDVWCENGEFYSGHNNPKYVIPSEFLLQKGLWVHAKNPYTLYKLDRQKINCFFHDTDIAVLTSFNYIWTYPGQQLTPDSIAVLPEQGLWQYNELKECAGICSNFIEAYKRELLNG